MPAPVPQCTLEQYETEFGGRHRLHDVVSYWAARKPDAAALIHHDRGVSGTWNDLDAGSTALATQLLRMGFRKGDFFATSLPFLHELILLEYACFKIGVIHAPLDLRLSPEEVIRSLQLIGSKGFAFLGQTRIADFRELGRAVHRHCPFVEHLIQLSPPEETIDNAQSFARLVKSPADDVRDAVRQAAVAVRKTDGAQVIFTTGSTGAPKPALLSHRGITCQNMCVGAGFGFSSETVFLVNLPPSHVGGQAEVLMTTLFHGGTAVVLEIFDAARSLEAIQRHGVTLIGQIPAMFNLEWRLSNYGEYDLSALQAAVYGGQQVSLPFLRMMAAMAPKIGTGLGLTEASGFCTYTPLTSSPELAGESLGYDMPVYRMSIRRPMREGGSAGEELPDGEVGHVCFQGPQTFLGYVNDPEATRKAVSADGILYTGDMGYRDAKGLHFSGRSRWVIKPAGYQVFPGEIEAHFCALEDKVTSCGVVGIEHKVFSEAIVAFVEKKPGAALTIEELRRHARSLTRYMRPLHYVILEPGQMPLNRVAKTDYVRLSEMARQNINPVR